MVPLVIQRIYAQGIGSPTQSELSKRSRRSPLSLQTGHLRPHRDLLSHGSDADLLALGAQTFAQWHFEGVRSSSSPMVTGGALTEAGTG